MARHPKGISPPGGSMRQANPSILASVRVHAPRLICRIGGTFCRLPSISWARPGCFARDIDGGCCSYRCVSRPPIWAFRVANARVELERAQTRLSGKPRERVTRELPALGCNTLSGRLYLCCECPWVGVAGFIALAARRTSSFVNTAKRNGCDSRK